MKTLSRILLCLACIMLLANCEKEGSLNPVKPDLDPNQVFSADFIVWDHSEAPTGENSQLIWTGEGVSALIGSFSVKITLLCNNSTGEFCNLEGSFLTEDGSKLFFMIPEGKIHPNTGEGCDFYQSCFNEMAEITGGTGRFVLVSGSFYPNAFIHNGNDHEDDKWFAKFSCKGKINNFNSNDHDFPHERDFYFIDY